MKLRGGGFAVELALGPRPFLKAAAPPAHWSAHPLPEHRQDPHRRTASRHSDDCRE